MTCNIILGGCRVATGYGEEQVQFVVGCSKHAEQISSPCCLQELFLEAIRLIRTGSNTLRGSRHCGQDQHPHPQQPHQNPVSVATTEDSHMRVKDRPTNGENWLI